MTDGEASGSGALSIEAAIAALDVPDEQGQAPAREASQAAPAAAPEAAAAAPVDGAQAGSQTQSEGATSTPDETAGAAAEHQAPEGSETEGGEPPAVAPAEPPKYWSQEAKAAFLQLPTELQAVVLAQEGPREAAAAKAKDEAQQIKAKAETELQGIQRFAEELGRFLPQAVQTFRSRWGDNPDWVAYAQQHGADQMAVAKARYEQERSELTRLAEASKQAETTAHQAFVTREFETLGKIAPELADPKEGPARRTEVTKFLVDQGIPRDALVRISAVEMSLAHDAMQWRRAKAKSVPQPAPKPAAAAPALARGAAAAGPSDPKAKVAATANNRFAQTRSINDAAALLDALGD